MNLGSVNNALTVIAFGKPFDEIIEERKVYVFKGRIPIQEVHKLFNSDDSHERKRLTQNDIRKLPGLVEASDGITFHRPGRFKSYFGIDPDNNDLVLGGFSLGANKYDIHSEGGKQSEDGKEIITGDTVEGDDKPQLPEEKAIREYHKLYAKMLSLNEANAKKSFSRLR